MSVRARGSLRSSTRARVLLVSTNRERSPQPVVPNGVACVASALYAAGNHVRVADLCFERAPLRALRAAASDFCPDVVGVSIRNLDNSDAIALRHYTPEAAAMLRTLRAASPTATILAGGAAFGVAPESLFDALEVDFAVAGDGERATVHLIDALAGGRSAGAIPGVVRRNGGGVSFEPPGENADLDALPAPGLHRWLSLRRYERHGATVPIQTKRGCVFKCVYCTYRNVEGWGYRLRDPGLVVDEIAELHREASISHFDFVDSTFNAPPRHAMAVCERIIQRGLRVHLHTTNFTPAAASDELLALMRGAGFASLGITAESASDAVLERLGKGFDAATVHAVAERVSRAGIRILWIFLVGGPGETSTTLEETLAFAAARLAAGDACYLTVGLRIYPGTTLHGIAVREGQVEYGDTLLAPRFYFSQALSFESVVQRLRSFAADHPRFMFSAESRSPLLPILTRAASLLRLPRPHWRYMGVFQRLARTVT